MSILEQLQQQYEKPVYAETLLKFSRRTVAEMAGVSIGYLCNVLSGSKVPSQELDKVLSELADQINAELTA